jgi:hypothetical protein
MNRRLKEVLATGLLVVGIGFVSRAQAGTFDTMNVLVTPGNPSYGVTITSVTVGQGYNFGQVNLNTSTDSTQAVGVLNSGNVSEYFVMMISTSTGGSANWKPAGSAGGANVDVFELYGRFYASASTFPGDAAFVGSDFIAGANGTNGANTYNQATTKTAGGVSKDLWMKLQMPTGMSLSDNSQRTMVLTITGQGT